MSRSRLEHPEAAADGGLGSPARPPAPESAPKRLLVLTTHPIQYQAPWFRAMASDPRLGIEVLFGHRATAEDQASAGFGVRFEWDLPLLEGYPHRFLRNVARRPGVSTFSGIDVPEVGALIRERRPDALLVNGWHYKGAWQACGSAWRAGIPILVRSDSHLRTRRHPIKRLLKWLPYRAIVPRIDACLAVGRWSTDYFLNYGAKPERIFLVPHVVDPQVFREPPSGCAERQRLRTGFGAGPSVTMFLFVGKFIAVKRPLDFVRAIAGAVRAWPGTLGVMVGDGPLLEECRREAGALGAPIVFTGFLNQSRISEAYWAADALVVPSEEETWGMVVSEAMAGGLPCIASDRVGAAADLITPAETGWRHSAGDWRDLAALISRLAPQRVRLQEMRPAVRRIAARYDVAGAVEGVVQAVAAVERFRRH